MHARGGPLPATRGKRISERMTIVVCSEMRFCISHEEEYWQMRKINLNSDKPQVIVTSLMTPIARFEDTKANRELAVSMAKEVWNEGKFVQVECWQSGHGSVIFKRTTGHCVG